VRAVSSKRIAYLVSRFPHPSETFILRELDEVDADPGLDLSLLTLFSPVDYVVHPAARPWLPRVRRPGALAAIGALLAWSVRRPLRTFGSIGAVVKGCARRPGVLARSLATLPLAAHHARFVERERIEHVHAHYATYPALAAWLVRRLTGVPYSFTAHAHDIFVDQSMLEVKVADAEFVVPISRYNARFLADYGGGRETPLDVVHCGIHPEAYPFAPRDAPADGPVTAACVASLQEYKGHRYLIEALAEPGLERLTLACVGEGPERDELAALASELGVGERVELAGGRDEAGVRGVLARSQLFVLPSVVAADGQMEGLPVAIMEALAGGLTVVASRLSGIPEIVIDGRTGILAEPGDVPSLAEALRRALEPGSVDHAGGRELVEEEFDVRRSGRELAALFKGERAP
jgi:glycosyltransferase involved in cell wall biosynthesis